MRRIVIAVAVCAVLALGGALLGHARSDDEPAMVSPAGAADRPPTAVTPQGSPGQTAAGAGIDGPSTSEVSESQVEAARVAAVRAVGRTRDVFEAGAISRRDVIAEFATVEFTPELAERTGQQVVSLLFGLRRAAGRRVEVQLVAQPVTATATATGDGRVVVQVWTVSVILAAGDSPVPEVWSTIHLEMALVEGRWLVDRWENVPGPAPAPAPEGAFGSDDEVATVLAWPDAVMS